MIIPFGCQSAVSTKQTSRPSGIWWHCKWTHPSPWETPWGFSPCRLAGSASLAIADQRSGEKRRRCYSRSSQKREASEAPVIGSPGRLRTPPDMLCLVSSAWTDPADFTVIQIRVIKELLFCFGLWEKIDYLPVENTHVASNFGCQATYISFS